jgi:hypothetical protein
MDRVHLVPEQQVSVYQGVRTGSKVIDSLALKEIGIDFDILSPLLRDGRFLEDGGHRACRLTSTTVDALFGIDIKLLATVEFLFSLGWMDTIHGADIDTGSIFRSHTRLGNYIGHS